MKSSDLKYLFAYIAPFSAFAGVYYQSWFAPGVIYIGFFLIPVLESLLPIETGNHESTEENKRLSNTFFDILLYLNIPLLFVLIYFALETISHRSLSNFEYFSTILNVGLIVSIIGINVAHELGHRQSEFAQFCSKALLMTAFYMHFNIEHNRGHHKHVATEEDAASARKGETLYFFILRSIFSGYVNAWKLENGRLQQLGLGKMHWRNEMIWFHLIMGLYSYTILAIYGLSGLIFAVCIAVVGVVLLEAINYIEHYGLRRKKMENGRYEKVQPWHSWNSDHVLGRIFLYELTRHSDHHYKANRKYQILRRMKEAPQLPFGYPASIIISLIPPIWFNMMDKRLPS